jgi:16S rRNA (guanine966-N2)-methyltransferase
MRIISGKHKGRRFFPPRNNPARPTTDIAKEGLFNILQNQWDFEEVAFLDLFGGTGSISFEMGSRGCTDITTVERHAPNIRFIQETAATLGLRIRAVKGDVFQFIANCPDRFDIIFAGPPYPLPTIPELPELVFRYGLLKPGGWFILEHNPAHNFSSHPHLMQVRTYGTTHFSIFTLPSTPE